MPLLADILTRVRQDIRDTASPQEFSDSELTRFVERARDEVSAAQPRERETTLTTDGTTRNLSLATLTNRFDVYSVEYPTGQWPPEYVSFEVWGDVLTMHLDAVPAAAQNAKVRWGSIHTLDAAGTTLTERQEDVVVLGAAAYALSAFAAQGSHKLLAGGATAQRALSSEAASRTRAYTGALRRLRSRLRRSQLYAPSTPGASQTTDPGPW